MIHEYAVDPDALLSFNEIWQALEQFGVAHGRMLVQCPKGWWGIVKKNLDDAEKSLGPAEYKTLEERCFRLKEARKIVRRKNLTYNGNKPFVEALADEHSLRPFRALLQLDPSVSTPFIVASNDRVELTLMVAATVVSIRHPHSSLFRDSRSFFRPRRKSPATASLVRPRCSAISATGRLWMCLKTTAVRSSSLSFSSASASCSERS